MVISRRPMSALAAALLLSACQAAPGTGAKSSFVLGPSLEATTSVVAKPAAGTGVLTVQLSGFLSDVTRKRVLATLADIDRVEVTVRQFGMVLQTITVPKSALSAGQATATFSGLPLGDMTVTMTAFDAAGTAIGSAMRAVSVAANTVTPVEMTLQLIPTPASTAPSGGGGTSPPTGGVAVTGTILDGPVGSPTPAVAGTVLSSFSVPHLGGFTALGNQKLYVVHLGGLGSPMGAHSMVSEVSTQSGAEGWSHGMGQQPTANVNPIHGPYLYDRAHDTFWYGGMLGEPIVREDTGGRIARIGARSFDAFAVDADGFAYNPQVTLISNVENQPPVFDYVLERKAADDTTTTLPIPAYDTVAFDSTGKLWAGWVPTPASSPVPQSSVRRYTAGGTLIDTIALPFVPRWMQPDGTGAMWVTDAPPHGTQLAFPGYQASTRQLVKVAADGTVGTPLSLPLSDFCVAPDHSVWIAGGTTVTKLAADGTTALTVPLASVFISAADGVIYIGDGRIITTLAP